MERRYAATCSGVSQWCFHITASPIPHRISGPIGEQHGAYPAWLPGLGFGAIWRSGFGPHHSQQFVKQRFIELTAHGYGANKHHHMLAPGKEQGCGRPDARRA